MARLSLVMATSRMAFPLFASGSGGTVGALRKLLGSAPAGLPVDGGAPRLISGNGTRGLAVALVLAAMVLIALGRAGVRRARQMERPGARRRKSMVGWLLVGAGFVGMIIGVVLW